MKLDENFFKPDEESSGLDVNEVKNIIKEKIEEKYSEDSEKVKELMDILEKTFTIKTIEEYPDDYDYAQIEESDHQDECPIVDMVENMLMASYEPKPFGISWNNSDIMEFMEEYGYNLFNKDDPSKCMACLPDEINFMENIEKDKDYYDKEHDFKKIFINLCRKQSIKMLLKAFKENDNN